MPALADDDQRRESGEYTRPRPLMSRPAVVIPLFLAVVAVILAVIFWPRPSPEELYAAAQPLVQSDNPDDWDRALDEYLDPLADRYPDREPKKVEADRTLLRDRRALRRALAAGAKAAPASEAERLYRRGLALAELGDAAAARRTWADLVTAFTDVPGEEKWVKLAAEGVEKLPEHKPLKPPKSAAERPALAAAVERAKKLKADDKPAEAAALLAALEDLYRNDPDALAVIRAAK
jgi:hypothetical protein